MRRALLAVLLVPLLGLSTALAGDAERLEKLLEQQRHYEAMLRDAKTETAAKYFVGRLEPLVREIRQLEQTLAQAEAQQSATEVTPLTWRVDHWLRARIGSRVQQKDVTLSDLTAWTRRELPEDLFAMLATWLGSDKPLSQEDTRKAWDQRSKKGWLTASYGSGTFIVEPPRRKPPRMRRGGGSGNDGDASIPKPPTRDGWWAKATAAQRTDWVMAYFVQNSALFEVAAKPDRKMCPKCKGEGLIDRHLCPRCGGAQYETTIRYR